ncbi:MAG: hypothetical protein ACLRZ9_02570 [Eubacterium sp.]
MPMKKGLFIFNTDNLNQSLINLYKVMANSNFVLCCCFLRKDSLALHSVMNNEMRILDIEDVYPLSQFDFIMCGRNCFGVLSPVELIDYKGIIYTDDTAFYEGRSVYGDVVFVNGDLNYQNICEIADFQTYKVGCLKGDTNVADRSKLWSENGKYSTKVLYIESGHYPFGRKGRKELSKAFVKIVLDNPDCEFVVKPRFLIGEANLASHKNEDYLFYYVKSAFGVRWPNNLVWLDEYFSLDMLISEADVIIHTYSSAHSQAALMRKKIINLVDIASEETADFRINRFNQIKRIIDMANNNVSIFGTDGCIANAKRPPDDYISLIGGNYTNPTISICNYINTGTCESYDVLRRRRVKGYFYHLLSRAENRFDDFDYFVKRMNNEMPFIYEELLDTGIQCERIKKKVVEIEIEYIMKNWQAICNNPFNRAYALAIFNNLNDEVLLNKILVEAYEKNNKDSSFYYYSTIYFLKNNDQKSARQNAIEYLKLTKDILYERLDSESKECIRFIKGVVNE